MAAPMPCAAPVTRATRPANRIPLSPCTAHTVLFPVIRSGVIIPVASPVLYTPRARSKEEKVWRVHQHSRLDGFGVVFSAWLVGFRGLSYRSSAQNTSPPPPCSTFSIGAAFRGALG